MDAPFGRRDQTGDGNARVCGITILRAGLTHHRRPGYIFSSRSVTARPGPVRGMVPHIFPEEEIEKLAFTQSHLRCQLVCE
jgi:hypothetical protein